MFLEYFLTQAFGVRAACLSHPWLLLNINFGNNFAIVSLNVWWLVIFGLHFRSYLKYRKMLKNREKERIHFVMIPIHNTNVWFMFYSICFNWHRISKLLMNFGCLFTFCYLDGVNTIKTDLQICSLWTGQLEVKNYVF